MKRAILLILFLLILYYLFQSQIYSFIQANPEISFILREITGRTLLGLFFITIFASLFLAFIPSEAIFLYYLLSEHNPVLIIMICTIGNTIGMCFNYLFGFLFGKFVMKKQNHKKEKWIKLVEKYGGPVLLIGNIIPSPIEPVSIGVGAFRYPFKKYVRYCAIGRFIKFLALYIIYIYFAETLLPYITVYFGV